MTFLWHGLTEQGAQVPVQVDAQGRVIAVDGTPGVSNWVRTDTTLRPVNPGDSVATEGSISAGPFDVTSTTARGANLSVGTNTTARLSVQSEASASGTSRCFTSYWGTTERFGIDLNGTITVIGPDPTKFVAKIDNQGAASFADNVKIGFTLPAAPKISLNAEGSASFAGNITAANVTFRSADPQFYVKKSKNKDALPEYVGPELDLLAEIARLEALVRHLYETLRLAPPAGWPVWDGNDDVLRQLRK